MQGRKWTRIQIGSPKNKIISTIEWKDCLFVATEEGLFYLENPKTEPKKVEYSDIKQN